MIDEGGQDSAAESDAILDAQRWRGSERASPDELVVVQCPLCGKRWAVHHDLCGHRIRCACRDLISVPARTLPSILPAQPPRLPRRSAPPRRLAARADPPDISVDERRRGVDRAWIQMILILGALIGPIIPIYVHRAGPDALSWWPFATLASGVLISLIGLIWPTTAFSALRPAPLRFLLLALVLGLGCGCLALGYGHLLPDQARTDPITQQLGIPLSLFVVAVCPGLFEEISFRGLIQGTLTEIWGGYQGIVMTASIFALCHGATLGLPCQFALGLLLGVVRQRSGSLYPGMLIHMLYNGVLVMAGQA